MSPSPLGPCRQYSRSHHGGEAVQIKNVNFKRHTLPCDVQPGVGNPHRDLNKDSARMSPRKHLLRPHSRARAHARDVTVLTPRDMTIHSNLQQGSPDVLRASAWIMFLHPPTPKPRWPLTCLHRLKMWCWNMCWIKQRLCRCVTNVSMMKVRTLMLYYLCYIV